MHPASVTGPAASTPASVRPHARPAAGRGRDRLPAQAITWLAALAALAIGKSILFAPRYVVTDTYYDLYAGRYIVHRGLPHANVFTASAHGTPWPDQQWLAHILFYGTWLAGGYPLLAALSAVLVSSGFVILMGLMLHRGVPAARAFAWTAVALLACLGNTAIRAQSFAYPLFALILWLLASDSRAGRLRPRTWLAVGVLVVWANIHGSVLLGAGLTGLYAAGRAGQALRRREFRQAASCLALGAAAGLSPLCTPYGIAVTGYYRHFVGRPSFAPYIAEWARPTLGNQASWAFFGVVALVAVVVAVCWWRGTRPDPLLAGLALVLLALALTGLRYQAWFGFAGSLLGADTLARRTGGRAPALHPAFARIVAATLMVGVLVTLTALAVTPARRFEQQVPVAAMGAAATAVAGNPGARVLGDEWSGTAMLWLHPELLGRVGFDIRLEQYPPAMMTAYADFLLVIGPQWARVTRGYRVIVIARQQHPRLAAALARLPGWRVGYRDGSGLVLVRTAGPVSH